MRFRSAATVLLALCCVALLAPKGAFAAEAGTFKIGALYENEQFRNNDYQSASAGNHGGIVLGYEKQQDGFWWAVTGKYQYGRLRDKAAYANIAKASGQGIAGLAYDMNGVALKPFVGLGISWEGQDEHGFKNFYSTEYVLPVGMRVERATDVGLLGMDLQFGLILGREIYGTDDDPYWGRRFFEGSYNVEAGIYYEPSALPVGFRPYYRYEMYQMTKHWSRVERQQFGVEAYVKF